MSSMEMAVYDLVSVRKSTHAETPRPDAVCGFVAGDTFLS